MANKLDMNEAFATLPDIPEAFKRHCIDKIPIIPIFYRRHGKKADCMCGKCGMGYTTEGVPKKNTMTNCQVCGHRGMWQWKRDVRKHYGYSDITLVQCTKDKNIAMRIFRVKYEYKQDFEAEIELVEKRRYFLHMGDVYKFYNIRRYDYKARTWKEGWGKEADNESIYIDELYYGYQSEIEKSNLKYCVPREIASKSAWYSMDYGRALLVYANNPAVEMLAKCGMKKIVDHLMYKEGKTKLINRRAKNVYSQLRIKDKKALKALISEDGDLNMLKVLQMEKKNKIQYTDEQRKFLVKIFGAYRGEQNVKFLLQFMTLKQLMNRTKKYMKAEGYYSAAEVIEEYKDYLEMRKELGYDMTNELYLYPKSLKEKHNLMVKERNAVKDELHSKKMNAKYPKIAERYEGINKKYGYIDDNYVIRPAMDASEIVAEGRELHHCVGRDQYLSSHDKGKTFILFLRKREAPDEPYYTIEIRDKEILQWYGIRDSKPDKEIIEPWLDAYVERLGNKTQEEILPAAG